MGLQYSIVAFAFLIVSNIGMQISAHMRENIYLLFLALSALTGSIGGWASARLYKFFNGSNWYIHYFTTVLLVP
jgi:predicted membrane-bound spermidine synthase